MSESSSKTTADLKTIQEWAEKRDGKPTRVKSTGDKKGGGVLRINFPVIQPKILWKKFRGRNGIKPSKIGNLPFCTRKKRREERKAGSLAPIAVIQKKNQQFRVFELF